MKTTAVEIWIELISAVSEIDKCLNYLPTFYAANNDPLLFPAVIDIFKMTFIEPNDVCMLTINKQV